MITIKNYSLILTSKNRLIAAIVILFLPILLVHSQCEKSSKVLLVNSYHKGIKWTDEFTLGIEKRLEENIAVLYIEYHDTKRQLIKNLTKDEKGC